MPGKVCKTHIVCMKIAFKTHIFCTKIAIKPSNDVSNTTHLLIYFLCLPISHLLSHLSSSQWIGVGSKDLSMEAEQTAWLTAHGMLLSISSWNSL